MSLVVRWRRSGRIAPGEVPAAPRLVEEPGGFVVLVESVGQARLDLPVRRELPAGAQVGGAVAAQAVQVVRVVEAASGGVPGGADAVGAELAVQFQPGGAFGTAR